MDNRHLQELAYWIFKQDRLDNPDVLIEYDYPFVEFVRMPIYDEYRWKAIKIIRKTKLKKIFPEIKK